MTIERLEELASEQQKRQRLYESLSAQQLHLIEVGQVLGIIPHPFTLPLPEPAIYVNAIRKALGLPFILASQMHLGD